MPNLHAGSAGTGEQDPVNGPAQQQLQQLLQSQRHQQLQQLQQQQLQQEQQQEPQQQQLQQELQPQQQLQQAPQNRPRRRSGHNRACPFCRYLFVSICRLFEHISAGCGDRRLRSQVADGVRRTALNRLQCDACGQYFRSLWFLGKHRLWSHRDLPVDVVRLLLSRLRHRPAIRDRWCDFLLSPPSNYVPSDEDTLQPLAADQLLPAAAPMESVSLAS